MKVWQCTRLNVSGVGGVEKHIFEVSRALKRLGHEVHIGSETPDGWQGANDAIVHTHGDSWPNPTKLKGFKWVHVCHGTSIGRVIACREFLSFSGWRGSVRDFYPTHFAHAAVAVGSRALAEARLYFRMKLPSAVIPNGADTSIFKPLQQVSLAPRLIFVGRADDRVKNVPAILDAAKSVFFSQPGLELWAAPGIDCHPGDYPFVKNLGALSSSALADKLSQVRALILCSFYEGDPIVLREAQAMGLPVIVSRIKQIRSNLGNYENAIYVNPRNTESISFGIKTALFNAAPAPKPQPRDWNQVAAEFDAFYKTLISAK